jgi:RNA polymerase sigma-70 factor (ECF subfamily)
MIGAVTQGLVGRVGFRPPKTTYTPLQWSKLNSAKEGSRLQFTAFDAPYLERLRSADGPTERHFVAYFSELIKLKLRSRVSSRDAADDVRQETFVRVLALIRAKDGVRQPERLGALVNSVCNHVLQEHYRSHRRVNSSIEEQPERAFISEAISTSGLFEAEETQAAVRTTLSALPERDRRLLQSVLLEERDKDEVCAELGLSRDYLRVLVHRAKQTFRTSYVKRGGETK